MLTASIGDLIQHDASLHKWSPYATEKWTLITSIDDYSPCSYTLTLCLKRTLGPIFWLQDRIVRNCALEKLKSMEDAQAVLREEVHRYNYHQVYSTTGEVPAIRFANAKKTGNSLFRPFVLPKPYKSAKDVFCLRTTRTVDGYRRISLDRHSIEVPKVDVRGDVDLRLIPDLAKNVLEVRIWSQGRLVSSVNLPLNEFRRFA